MSAPNAGINAAAASAVSEDAHRGSIASLKGQDPEQPLSSGEEEGDHPTAPDQHDPKFVADKKEIWSYYSYYVGNNGLSMFNFAPTAYQDLLYLAAGDSEILRFLGQDRTINSIVLLSNGISFAIQVVLFLVLGSLADYGSWRPYILIFWSIVAFALGFGWLGVHREDLWPVGTGMYMVGLIAYQMCFTFWFAAFPGLARNTPEMREKAREYEAGKIDREEYDFEDMMQRNRLSNVAFIMQSAVEIVILAILVGILKSINPEASDANNLWSLSVTIAYATAIWVVCAIPWFIFEKHRPGQKVPAGMNLVSVGFWTLWRAAIAIWKLKQSLIYLIGFFILSDSLNTTVTVVATLQNEVLAYDPLTITYLFIVGIAAQLLGIWGFWTVQKRFRRECHHIMSVSLLTTSLVSTKNMFDAVIVGIIILDLWGMIGIWTQTIGFHHKWEFWLYQVWYGIAVCPW
jgi:MFS-type transporter involved in bile tolerance (Atg22 family)